MWVVGGPWAGGCRGGARRSELGALCAARAGAVGLWFSGIFYGFAHGLMASLVAQFGGAVLVALAAGGLCEHDRAQVRVTAHAFGLAAGGSVWWVPKVKSRASGGLNGEGPLRSDSKGCGPQRFGFVASFRTGLRGAVGRRSLLVVAQCSGSLPASAPEGSRLVRWHQAVSLLLGCCFVRPDTTGPACLGKPRRRGEEPRTQHPCGVKDPPNEVVGYGSEALVRCELAHSGLGWPSACHRVRGGAVWTA